MVNAQELETQRLRFGLEAETVARLVQSNGVNNQPRAVDENIAVNGIIPPHRQPIAPRDRAQHPPHMMYEEDVLDLDGAGATGAIVLPALPPGVKFTITSTMIQLLNLKGMFRGAAGDDVNPHLINFVAICKSQEIPGVSKIAIRLRLFPLSLTVEATNWLNEMSVDSNRTWTELNEAFIERFFSKSKELLCGGSFMKKPFSESMQLLDKVSTNNRAWYTRDAEVGDLSAEQRKREEERDQDMAHMRTQIDLLTKHIVSKSEKVNVVSQPNRFEDQDIDLDEEANYLGNQGSFQNYNLGNQGYNSGNADRNFSREGYVYVPPGNRDWESGSSNGSKLEDMFAKVLQKVESTDAGLKEMKGEFSSMSQLVDSHTTSIKQIEQQLGQLSASLNQSKNGSLLSDTIKNPKKDGHCMAFATRSGKILIDPISATNPKTTSFFPQRLKKKVEDGKFAKFITMLRQLVIATRSMVLKKEDPGAFTILYSIRSIEFAKALCDLGASINLMPLTIYKQLGLGVPKPTAMRLMMADRSVK
ncbi:uncharacterized protein LOC125821800 [Solanum verrucosum]|uniref:uncharacterized protein LOC125821800 n=1 Tax=Solanum verrucosum TaxID=315347 RepID=UPI0020D0EA21|nr:uncharacterized protein LOC125821800 [Solanum verrucosum]